MPTPTFTLIEEITVSGSVTSSVSFTAIPQTYDELVWIIKGDNALDEAVLLRYNSDSGTNYQYVDFRAAGGVAGQGNTTGATSINLTINGTENTDYYIWGRTLQYTNANWRKKNHHLSFNPQATQWYAVQGSGTWQSTSAITTITFLTSAGTNFVAGSIFQLYGIKGSN